MKAVVSQVVVLGVCLYINDRVQSDSMGALAYEGRYFHTEKETFFLFFFVVFPDLYAFF